MPMYTELASEISVVTSQSAFISYAPAEISPRQQLLALVEQLLVKKQDLVPLTGALIFFDIDRFRLINSVLDYKANANLLDEIIQRICAQLPQNSRLIRIETDKFGLLLDAAAKESVLRLIEQIKLILLTLPFQQAEYKLHLTASFGIAFSYPYATIEQLLCNAELAMHEAKLEGVNQWVIFKPSMATSLKQRLLLESELRLALERSEFEVYYQQVVALKKNRRAGWHYEALVRWQHPKRGLLNPGEFLPLAEELDLSSAIGWQVFKKTCQQISKWQHLTKTYLQVNINICNSQFWQPGMVEKVQEILKETGAPVTAICLEITEKVVMHDSEAAKAILRRLKQTGLKLAIDDFGTGHSSLSALYHLPVDVLKIDKSFIDGLQSDTKKFAIVKTIIALATILGHEVVAEGVETKEQAGILRRLGCKFGQGYYFARPIGSEAAFPFANQMPRPEVTLPNPKLARKLSQASWC
jgi:diguanylate cyclase (GGDEF)-like protein